MNKFHFFLTAIAFCVLAISCHKQEEDVNNPVISIASPTGGVSISGVVSITGTVTDESLHEMSIRVTKDSDGSELFLKQPTVHEKSEYTFSESWTPSGIADETAVTLAVTVSDHHEHTVVQTVKFTVKP